MRFSKERFPEIVNWLQDNGGPRDIRWRVHHSQWWFSVVMPGDTELETAFRLMFAADFPNNIDDLDD